MLQIRPWANVPCVQTGSPSEAEICESVDESAFAGTPAVPPYEEEEERRWLAEREGEFTSFSTLALPSDGMASLRGTVEDTVLLDRTRLT